jgi:L-alanine-DL-glutamate epimerase-like enolase superfamily enzyme
VIEVGTDAGVVGYAETCTAGANYLEGSPESVTATIPRMAAALLGVDPFASLLVDSKMDDAVSGHAAAKSAIDIACWDIKGKALGLPVCDLLGGPLQTSLPVFDALSVSSPESMADYARSMREHGFGHYQVKLEGQPRADLQRVHAAAEAVGSWDFMTCDANAGYSRASAMRFIRMLGNLDVFIEQPCLDIEDLADLRSRSTLPFIADECVTSLSALLRLNKCRAADGINLKMTRVGGLTKACQLRDVANAMGLLILVDEPCGADLAFAAKIQLAATVDPDRLVAVSGIGTPVRVSVEGSGMRHEARVEVGRAPGFGLTVDEGTLGRAVVDVHEHR